MKPTYCFLPRPSGDKETGIIDLQSSDADSSSETSSDEDIIHVGPINK